MSRNNDPWLHWGPLSPEEQKQNEHDDQRLRFSANQRPGHGISEDSRFGMLDQCSANADGSPDLPFLFAHAREEGEETGLIHYLRRIRCLTDDELRPLLDRLGGVVKFPLPGEAPGE